MVRSFSYVEWRKLTYSRYHGKCLKIARGKVKDVDNYTCPICDHRVKIPRDAARPKLEDLLDWAADMEALPFQPDEEDVLESIIQQATDFREILKPYLNPMAATTSEIPTQIFWLRKIEGAEILLAFETNFFRQELHRMNPVAPEAPKILQESLSTRKPRPTKQQKLMAQHGVERPEDLPQHLRTKAHVFKRKSEDQQKPPPLLQPRSASSEHAPPNPLHDRHERSNPILVQMQSDFPRYHGETEMTWGANNGSSAAHSNAPIFASSFTTAPMESPFSPTTHAPLDAGRLFSPGEDVGPGDVTPMFESSSQTQPPPDEELFAGVNLDGEDEGVAGDGEDGGLGMTSHAMDALEAMNSASASEDKEDEEDGLG
jgi:[histone H3]-trimethyl-L-lysine4 demethylase